VSDPSGIVGPVMLGWANDQLLRAFYLLAFWIFLAVVSALRAPKRGAPAEWYRPVIL
jgi:hypothetical protein